jgi:uncharacterized membrane protein YhdT
MIEKIEALGLLVLATIGGLTAAYYFSKSRGGLGTFNWREWQAAALITFACIFLLGFIIILFFQQLHAG